MKVSEVEYHYDDTIAMHVWQGLVSLVDETRRVIVQGVYELFEKERSTEWGDSTRLNRLVFIGMRSV